ncbi:MAG: hypothetical protein ACR2H4_08400 [Pyrinomonadaceae bacterium]
MNKLVSLLIAAVAALLLGNAVGAQESTPRTGLYLEVVDQWNSTPGIRPVPAADSKFEGGWGPFKVLPSWSPPGDFLPVRAVNVLYRMEGEAVRVKVSVFLGKKSHEKEEQVATFLARENVKVTITELKRWGVVPYEVTPVRVASSALGSPPEVVNRTQSIEVVHVEPVQSAPATFRLVLRNLSSKYVSAIKMMVMQNNQRHLSALPAGEEGKPLIGPGETWKAPDYGLTKIEPTSGGYVLSSAKGQTVVVATVVFQDGSYEGDAQFAVQVRGYVAGRKQQLARVIALFKGASETNDSDGVTILSKLRAQLASLEIVADPVDIEKVLTDIPDYSPNRNLDARKTIEVTLTSIRRNVISDIDLFMEEHRRNLESVALRKWLSATRQRYENWLSRLEGS